MIWNIHLPPASHKPEKRVYFRMLDFNATKVSIFGSTLLSPQTKSIHTFLLIMRFPELKFFFFNKFKFWSPTQYASTFPATNASLSDCLSLYLAKPDMWIQFSWCHFRSLTSRTCAPFPEMRRARVLCGVRAVETLNWNSGFLFGPELGILTIDRDFVRRGIYWKW